MRKPDLDGSASDLERFARQVRRNSVCAEQVGQFERSMRWDFPGSTGASRAIQLRSGIDLNVTRLAWERPWTLRFNDAATGLKFSMGRGSTLRITPEAEPSYVVGAGTFRVTRVAEPAEATCDFVGSNAQSEQVALEIEPARLKELCGAATLPLVLDRLLASDARRTTYEQTSAPAMLGLTDELFHCDAQGASRQLFWEAKGLELLSALIGGLEEASEAAQPFGRRDLERLECAKLSLVARMDDPPSLRELAREVGLNELKLKQGFRTLYGTSVYGYLRTERMEAAQRLLRRGELGVTEVALRVGYANPSKFAAAFRRHFGVVPSALRR